jgi:hypothetical protein
LRHSSGRTWLAVRQTVKKENLTTLAGWPAAKTTPGDPGRQIGAASGFECGWLHVDRPAATVCRK